MVHTENSAEHCLVLDTVSY